MFAEELGGNSQRKKAQEAKARRQRLKQEQERKAISHATSLQPAVTLAAPPTATTAPSSAATTSGANAIKLTAVQKANKQREIRAALAGQKQAACIIQKRVRGNLQRFCLLLQLDKKLSDLGTLQTILQKKTKTYIAPTATVLSLVQQFLLCVSSRPQTSWDTASPIFDKLLVTSVLPGLEQNQSPLAEWISTRLGCMRLRRLLKFLLYFSCHIRNYDSGVACLRLLLLGDSENLQKYCRSLMLMGHDKTAVTLTKDGDELDLIQNVRKDLLTLTKTPIPSDTEDKRDAIFTDAQRRHAGDMVKLLFELSENNKILQARLVKDILVVPLLTWRVSSTCLEALTGASESSSESLLMTLLQSFTKVYASEINREELEMLLEAPDLNMAVCGATGSQILLANLLQLGRLIPSYNGTVVSKQDFCNAALFFRVVAALINVVPVGTYISSRESSIAWIAVDGNNHKPIVLSPVIMEQCRALLVDNYVRRVFLSAMNAEYLKTDAVLAHKNEQDLKDEKELQETESSSAASLAAKEARLGQSKNFWNASGWAKKLARKVTKLLPKDGDGLPTKSERTKKEFSRSEGQLMNTSSLSRKLADGSQQPTDSSSSPPKLLQSSEYSTELLFALARTFAIVLARWGGGGNDDIVYGKTRESKGCDIRASSQQDPLIKAFLNVLCFSTPFVRVAWALIQSESDFVRDVYAVIDRDKGRTPIRSLNIKPLFEEDSEHRKANTGLGAPLLYMFLCVLSHVLIVTDDSEIHTMDRPIPIHQIRRCIQVLKKLLYRATCVEYEANTSSADTKRVSIPNYFGLALISAAARVMRDLYDRSSRRPICIPSLWIVEGLLESEIGRCKTYKDYQDLLSSSVVLRVCPYMVPFKRRLKLFERTITTNRVEIQGENSANPFHNNPLKPGIPVKITRGRLLEDGLATMNNLGPNLRQRISVLYYNEAGTRETGVDAGGLFKEFWTDLCSIAFDPNYALFKVTDSFGEGNTPGIGNCLYPNPSSSAAHGSDHITLFSFLGRILGKAMYEGITIPPVFAHFFLSFLKGDYNFLHMLPDLSTMDPQLYNNLMFLKTYEGAASDLTLTFTVTVDDFGGTREIPLIRNGGNVEVNDENKHLYIGLVAKYYVYDRIKEQSEAMTRGLFEVVDRTWLRIFNEPELQVLISGATDGKIDVDDMRAHCQYAGGFTGIDITVNRFWKVLASLDQKQQGALLRFVTSCERPPPLGFKSLNPPFTIQRVGIFRDGDKLPTASTCFNVLKLPTYSSEKVMRERLIYAIEAGAGFELT